jgi:nicotinamide-nucleotide amidase
MTDAAKAGGPIVVARHLLFAPFAFAARMRYNADSCSLASGVESVNAEIVAVGTELLLGQITDTNATYICQKLAEIGVDVYFRSTVGDNWERMAAVLRAAMARADVVIVTGGLGPTNDDITREVIADLTGRPLELDPEAERRLREFFASRHPGMPPSNLKQAMVPKGARILQNSCGTAPGLIVEVPARGRAGTTDGRAIIALPGPPHEMKAMLQESVIPYLRRRAGERVQITKSRVLKLVGIGESAAAEQIRDLLDSQTDPTIAPLASPGEVRLRITTKAASNAEADRKIAGIEAQVRERLGAYVFGADEETLEGVVGDLLRRRGKSLAVAESCTGGLIGSRITDVPGSSDYFLGSLVTYSNDAKANLLGVSRALLQEKGAVSEEVARAMAEGVRKRLSADMGLGVTGIAGPTGGTPEKPVGLVYIALADGQETQCERHNMFGDRVLVKYRTSQVGLDMVRRRLAAEGE